MALKESKEIPPEPEPKVEEPKAGVPEQYQGKSSDELIQLLQEKDKFAGDQSQQIGTLRKLIFFL